MTKKVVLDIETDMIPTSKLWMVGCVDVETKEVTTFLYPVNAEEVQSYLSNYDVIIGHNIIGFDKPEMAKYLKIDMEQWEYEDTMLLSKLWNPSIDGGHSLGAWGRRLGEHKGDYTDFDNYCQEMIDYCIQDITVTEKLYALLKDKLTPFGGASQIDEVQVKELLVQQENNGWLLDQGRCFSLLAELKERKLALEDQVHKRFIPLATFVKEVVPKDKKTGGFSVVGLKFLGDNALDLVVGKFSRVDFPEFNLGSRQQVGRYLQYFGWVPKDFTEAGNAIVNESVLKDVKIPEAQLIAEYFLVTKRMAMISSWVEAVKDDGRVHGRVDTLGAVTHRMTHNNPNVAQVPAAKKDKEGSLLWGEASNYGTDCRACWIVPKGYQLVGCDASGLELRMLAHYMGDASYTQEILDGDIHSANQRAAGLPTRDQAKTFIYAFLYGAGDSKIGSIVGGTAAAGKKLKSEFLSNTPALADLRTRVDNASARGYLKGLDGRKLIVKSSHAALNVLLQSAGALVMKKALLIFDKTAKLWEIDFRYVGNIHDEVQMEVRSDQAANAGWLFKESIKAAGVAYNMKCPLDGDFKVGDTWAETH